MRAELSLAGVLIAMKSEKEKTMITAIRSQLVLPNRRIAGFRIASSVALYWSKVILDSICKMCSRKNVFSLFGELLDCNAFCECRGN